MNFMSTKPDVRTDMSFLKLFVNKSLKANSTGKGELPVRVQRNENVSSPGLTLRAEIPQDSIGKGQLPVRVRRN
jgi:hypothetical protein